MKEYPLGYPHRTKELQDPVSALLVASIGMAGYSAYSQSQSASKAQAAQNEAELRAREIAAEKKPLEESATLKTNAINSANNLGALGLLIAPDENMRPKSMSLGGNKSSGVGSTTATGLGFGV
jgi:hypothetical protein